MEKRILLCADTQSVRDPSLIGLDGESLARFPWLACTSGAECCRAASRGFSSLEEAWIVSCDDMDGINVAAALKHDNPTRRVFLVAQGQNGSLASRASAAHIDGLWTQATFLKRYAQVKSALSETGGSAKQVGQCGGALAAAACGKGLVPVSEKSQGNSLQAASRSYEARNEGQDKKASRGGIATRASVSSDDGATVIAVVSGSGGSGKSTIAALAGSLCALASKRTVILDADFQFGDIDTMLGQKEPLRIDDVIQDPSRMLRLKDEAKHGSPALLAAPKRLESSDVVVGELPAILEALCADYEIVVANTGALWGDVHAVLLEHADTVVFLIDQRPSSLKATVHAVELCARLGVATSSFVYVVNRHERASLLSAVDVSCALHGAHAVELPHGGRDVDELLGLGTPKELIESRNAFVAALRELLVRILPSEKASAVESYSIPAKKKRLFGKD